MRRRIGRTGDRIDDRSIGLISIALRGDEGMNRDREILRIRERLLRLCSPRAQMMLIVAITGGAGWLASSALRHFADIANLAPRYALSLLAAYAVFLILLRLWVLLHDKAGGDSLDVPSGDGASSSTCRSQDAQVDAYDADGGLGDLIPDGFPDIDDAGILLVALLAVGALVVGALWTVWIAPTLLAELVLDVTLASGLYRRLRRIESRYWLRTAIRRTVLPFAIALATTAAVGAGLDYAAPDATTLGEALAAIARR